MIAPVLFFVSAIASTVEPSDKNMNGLLEEYICSFLFKQGQGLDVLKGKLLETPKKTHQAIYAHLIQLSQGHSLGHSKALSLIKNTTEELPTDYQANYLSWLKTEQSFDHFSEREMHSLVYVLEVLWVEDQSLLPLYTESNCWTHRYSAILPLRTIWSTQSRAYLRLLQLDDVSKIASFAEEQYKIGSMKPTR